MPSTVENWDALLKGDEAKSIFAHYKLDAPGDKKGALQRLDDRTSVVVALTSVVEPKHTSFFARLVDSGKKCGHKDEQCNKYGKLGYHCRFLSADALKQALAKLSQMKQQATPGQLGPLAASFANVVPSKFRKEGCPLISRRVRREVDDLAWNGTITGWWPAEEEGQHGDQSLWEVEDDKDSQHLLRVELVTHLYREEVLKALDAFEKWDAKRKAAAAAAAAVKPKPITPEKPKGGGSSSGAGSSSDPSAQPTPQGQAEAAVETEAARAVREGPYVRPTRRPSVQDKIRVYFEDDEKWFTGTVKSVSSSRGFQIEYDHVQGEDEKSEYIQLLCEGGNEGEGEDGHEICRWLPAVMLSTAVAPPPAQRRLLLPPAKASSGANGKRPVETSRTEEAPDKRARSSDASGSEAAASRAVKLEAELAVEAQPEIEVKREEDEDGKEEVKQEDEVRSDCTENHWEEPALGAAGVDGERPGEEEGVDAFGNRWGFLFGESGGEGRGQPMQEGLSQPLGQERPVESQLESPEEGNIVEI